MSIDIFRDKKSERLGLLVAAVIFGLIAIVQLWRALAGISIEFGGHFVPVWLSVIIGSLALLMSFWMGTILRRNRPVL